MTERSSEQTTKSRTFNPIPWAFSILILAVAWSLIKRPLNECEPTSFEAFQLFKVQLGGCTKAQVEPVPPGVKAQVYFHIADESQRKSMITLQERLKFTGYSVQSIENVKGKADIPRNPNVRFFNDSDEAVAKAVVSELKKLGYATASPYRVNMKAPVGAIEVWLSNPSY